MGMDMGDISNNYSHAAIPTVTGATAVSEGKYCTPHPATATACATYWLMDAFISTHIMTHPTGIFAPHPTLVTSADSTHTIILQTESSSVHQLSPHCMVNTADEQYQAVPKMFTPHKSLHF